ncbi:hypothetical protein Tco_0157847 [Tanacetum coccineum]
MLAIPNEHLLNFHACKDAKSLWEDIKKRFRGNKESKKMQKTILKQNYENFTASSQEGLDKTYDSKSDLDTLSMDDLYNNLKVYEYEIKGKSSSSSNSQNVAFVSTDNSSSTNEIVNTAYSISAASSKDQASTASYADDAEEGITNFALMAYTSQGSSSSSSSDSEFSLPTLGTTCPQDLTYPFKDIVKKPKTDRPSDPIIEDWDTDSDNDSVFRPKFDKTKPKFTKINFVKSGENVKSVYKENTHRQVEYPRKNCQQSQKGWPVNAAKQSSSRAAASISTTRPVNIAPKSKEMLLTIPPKTVDHTCLKDLTCWSTKGNPQYTLHDQMIFDSGCSRHMTGNKSSLTDYQEIDGGFIAFRGSPKGGKITGKGKIRTGKLEFEDVYFAKELKFNFFSISHMCDKKNSVLFTETECLVLSPDFKLLDESQVLLKVPRQNNMYSFDLKNIVPSGGLTCFICKGYNR